MKRLFIVLLLILFIKPSFSQSDSAKTILYMIPFYAEKIDAVNPARLLADNDIYSVSSFQLVAFWEGAKLALENFERAGVDLNVIVRDISYDSVKMKAILEDTVMMKKVDLIIGPFYRSMFEIASKYAADYKIPILNPFSNRADFLKENEYTYKLIPSVGARPHIISESLLKMYPHNTLTFWGNEDAPAHSKVYKCYEDYFIEHNIPFAKRSFREGAGALVSGLKNDHQNIVIALAKPSALAIQNLRNLASNKKLPPLTLIVPESWIEDIEAEIDNFNRLQVCYFSNYYVDKKEEKTAYFISEFIERFQSPPDLTRFSYQGYDITNYFVNCILHDFDTTKFTYTPVSLDFEFKKMENGGYENQKARLLRLENFEVIEVKPN